jgi:hypothetical protein
MTMAHGELERRVVLRAIQCDAMRVLTILDRHARDQYARAEEEMAAIILGRNADFPDALITS